MRTLATLGSLIFFLNLLSPAIAVNVNLSQND